MECCCARQWPHASGNEGDGRAERSQSAGVYGGSLAGLSWHCAARARSRKCLPGAAGRARCEIQKSAAQPTANSAERNLTAVMAVSIPAARRRSTASNGQWNPARKPASKLRQKRKGLVSCIRAHLFTAEGVC